MAHIEFIYHTHEGSKRKRQHIYVAAWQQGPGFLWEAMSRLCSSGYVLVDIYGDMVGAGELLSEEENPETLCKRCKWMYRRMRLELIGVSECCGDTITSHTTTWNNTKYTCNSCGENCNLIVSDEPQKENRTT